MKTTTVAAAIIALAGSALAAPAPKDSYQGLAIHSGSDIQYATVNANGGNFWLHKKTATYCPSQTDIKCSNTTATLFTGGKDTLNLKVVVPGGQQVYVDSTGALKYTQPHSAAIGEGSSQTGFSVAKAGKFDHLKYNGSGFLACPADGDKYRVYVSGGPAVNDDEECLVFDFMVGPDNAPAAWEYS